VNTNLPDVIQAVKGSPVIAKLIEKFLGRWRIIRYAVLGDHHRWRLHDNATEWSVDAGANARR